MTLGKILKDLLACGIAGLVYFGLYCWINAGLQETQWERQKRELQQRKWSRRNPRKKS